MDHCEAGATAPRLPLNIFARGFFVSQISSNLIGMPEPIDQKSTLLLARAFDLAWEQYYGPDHDGPLSEEIARPALAKFLVDIAKSGVKEENALAACGVLHLVALTMERRVK
jgi:hypothetical protein